MACGHANFRVLANVVRLEDTGRFVLEVRVSCADCDEPFRFLGLPAGLDLTGAAVSVEGEEARLAIGTKETIANILEVADSVGFTVKRDI